MSRTILIVEDNELNLKLFRDLLSAEGFRTVLARDGATALEEAAATPPDLILMDIQLPHMSGIEAARQIRATEALSRIPIIAISAFARRGELGLEAGDFCDDYVVKPILPSALLSTVRRFLH